MDRAQTKGEPDCRSGGRGRGEGAHVELSIGILAHNEAENIARTLESLLQQDALSRYASEIVVLANGCSDDTAAVARRTLGRAGQVAPGCRSARVEELAKPGKANAWNTFVHQSSAGDADYLVLLDADVVLAPGALEALLRALEGAPEAVLAVDVPRKDPSLARTTGLLHPLFRAATPTIDPSHIPLCGQFYCARAAELRRVKLPLGIQVDDGFIRALVLTRGFTQPEDPRRIVLARDASHAFAPVSTLRELLLHERWIVAGSIVNMLLFERFHREAGHGMDAVQLMDAWASADGDWLHRFVAAEVRRRGWGLLPVSWWTRRWRQLRKRSGPSWWTHVPIAAAASAVDALVFLAAIHEVRRKGGAAYWAA